MFFQLFSYESQVFQVFQVEFQIPGGFQVFQESPCVYTGSNDVFSKFWSFSAKNLCKENIFFEGLNWKSTSYILFYGWIRNFSMKQIFIYVLLKKFFLKCQILDISSVEIYQQNLGFPENVFLRSVSSKKISWKIEKI